MVTMPYVLPVPNETVDNVPCMNINDEDSIDFAAIITFHGLRDTFDQIIDLLVHLLGVVFQGLLLTLLHLIKDILYLPRPPNLVSSQHHHALIIQHPINPSEKK